MDAVVNALNSYRGRDRVIRTCGYTCFFLSGFAKATETKEKLCILGTQLSSCRTILRLFDDVAMLQYTLQYGLGNKERDAFQRWLSVVCNIVDQLFYPVEHIAWAADHRIIRVNSGPWWFLSTYLWGISLYLNILRTLRSLFILRKKRNAFVKIVSRSDTIMDDFRRQMFLDILSLIEFSVDLCNAVHWMPDSFLWAGKLKLWQVGLLGLISSVVGAYKML